MSGRAPAGQLRALLTDPDPEVQRAALLSATRRPSRELLDVLVDLLLAPGLGYEAREAVAALGDPAVPRLASMLAGSADARAQRVAAQALAHIASPRAAAVLVKLARSADARLRHVGLRALARVRVRSGRPVLSRARAHRLFLRDLHDYRHFLEPARALEHSSVKEIRLLGESFRESASMALERALEALACWYDPRPLFGVFDRLVSGDRHQASPALEYLGHILPRGMFRPVGRIFEPPAAEVADPTAGVASDEDESQALAGFIQTAWTSGDAWLRACAVRAARFVPGFDRALFAEGEDQPMVRAEIEALSHPADRLAPAVPAAAVMPGAPAC
jgi:hypothetical protein